MKRLDGFQEDFEDSEEEEDMSQLGSEIIQLGCNIIQNIKKIKEEVLDFS